MLLWHFCRLKLSGEFLEDFIFSMQIYACSIGIKPALSKYMIQVEFSEISATRPTMDLSHFDHQTNKFNQFHHVFYALYESPSQMCCQGGFGVNLPPPLLDEKFIQFARVSCEKNLNPLLNFPLTKKI